MVSCSSTVELQLQFDCNYLALTAFHTKLRVVVVQEKDEQGREEQREQEQERLGARASPGGSTVCDDERGQTASRLGPRDLRLVTFFTWT